MATLTNTKIKDTYDGLLKTTNNEAIAASGVTLIEDGLGNASALSVGRANNGVTITGNLAVDTNTLYVDAANNRVGIGTSSPTFNLEVENSSGQAILGITAQDGNYSTLLFGDVSNNYVNQIRTDHSANALTFHTATTTLGGNERMRIDSSGRVFIGTTSAFDANAITMSDNGQVFANNFAIANAAGSVGGTSPNLYSPASATLAISTGGSERMRIDSDGNVIIKEKAGAFTPATNGLSLSTGYGVSYLFSKSSGGTEADMYYNAANQIFNTGGSERMRIDSSGVVKIGGTDTGYSSTLLHTGSYSSAQAGINILNSTTGIGYILFGDGDGGASYTGQIAYKHGDNYMAFQTADAERMRITSGGDVLIGTTSNDPRNFSGGTYGVKINQSQSEFAQTTMYINRSIASNGDAVAFRRDGVSVGSISVTAVSTAYNTSSDYRLKENVVPMENALDRVDALKPSRFNFIADPKKTVDGFLAHEVAEVIPEAISGEKDAVDEEGNPIYQGIDQSKIVPLLVGAIQELKAEIELLKSQING